jgi:dolichol-phosphate mannosyltransferase
MSEPSASHLPFRLPATLAFCEPWLMRLFKWRYIRFATVGASGTVVNIGVLYVLQEWVLPLFVVDASLRLSLALACAIAVATVNNFAWNSVWTWADRLALAPGAVLGWDKNTFSRLLKYAMSCWLGMLIQYSMTLLLSLYIYYLLANVVSILLASVSNYLTNDWWTFRQKPVHPTE